MSERVLTVAEVAQRYGVSEASVLGWIKRHELRALNVGKRPGKKRPRWRVTLEALSAWELGRTNNPPPPRIQRRKPNLQFTGRY